MTDDLEFKLRHNLDEARLGLEHQVLLQVGEGRVDLKRPQRTALSATQEVEDATRVLGLPDRRLF